jgi:hypothetical protein
VTQQKTWIAFVVQGTSKAALALNQVFEVKGLAGMAWKGKQPW